MKFHASFHETSTVVLAKTTSGPSATSSAAYLRVSGLAAAPRASIHTLRPSDQPAACPLTFSLATKGYLVTGQFRVLLLPTSLPHAVQQFRRSRLQGWILVLIFLVVLRDSIEVPLRAEWRFLKCFERFACICISIR